jgi:DNA primase catalytic subunit
MFKICENTHSEIFKRKCVRMISDVLHMNLGFSHIMWNLQKTRGILEKPEHG